MQALVIVIFVREVSHITPLTNSILLISGMMNLILTLTFIAGMVIDQHPTCVPCDPRSLALYSGWNLLALFIQLNNNWEGIKKEISQAIIHVSLTENVLCLFHMLNLPVMQQCTCTLCALLSQTNCTQSGSLTAVEWCQLGGHGQSDMLKARKCCWLCPENLIFFLVIMWVTANCLG